MPSSSAGWAATTAPTTIIATRKSTPEVRTLEVPVAGGALAVELCGAGPTLLLLHGWSLDRTSWSPQKALADRFRLILPDRRGFGHSTAPPDIASEPADLLQLCDRLGLERPVLVGMSQGGRVALEFALRHPERVAGLVLQGAPVNGFLPSPNGGDSVPIDLYRQLVREGRIEEMKALWRDHPLMRGAHADELLAGYDGRDLLAPTSLAMPLAGALGEIEAPALVVTGEHETAWLRLVGDAIAYGLPNAHRAHLPGSHLCNISDPEPYNALVASFAAEVAG
jgi:pimeloyl-ACP methyl ester carboxylesterase